MKGNISAGIQCGDKLGDIIISFVCALQYQTTFIFVVSGIILTNSVAVIEIPW